MNAAARSLVLVTVALVAANSCAQPEPETAPVPAAVVETAGPDVRIGILVNVPRATLGGGAPLTVIDPDEGNLRTIEAGATLDAVVSGFDVSLLDGNGPILRRALVVAPADSGALLRLNGREYHGVLELHRGTDGLIVVNRVPLEQYLTAVVGIELGRRTPAEIEAVKAQAIVSRTYAMRNQGRWKDLGFDLVGTVNDQVYTGEPVDNALAVSAVAATRGQVVTWNGQVIDAFFSSTCGGETEDGDAAFSGARRPYLRGVDDRDPSGVPWCAGSPRLNWSATWTATQLATTLRRTLAAENLPGARSADLRSIRITSRSRTGRVASIELAGRDGSTMVSGQAIRRVLATPEGILRSTDFAIRLTQSGSRLERVSIEGRGNGHAVGMCQWGAIGRARAGQDYATILTSYFPGTEVQRLY
jgi:stage II sporulation protein D